jgi:hypothetical protein
VIRFEPFLLEASVFAVADLRCDQDWTIRFLVQPELVTAADLGEGVLPDSEEVLDFLYAECFDHLVPQVGPVRSFLGETAALAITIVQEPLTIVEQQHAP